MAMRENVEQYLKLLESQITPEPIKAQIRDALYAIADLADVLAADPLSRQIQSLVNNEEQLHSNLADTGEAITEEEKSE